MAFLVPYRPYLDAVLIVLAAALIASILMQSRGASLGSVFGGTGAVFKTRRGIEKLLFNITIFIGVLFGLVSFLVWMIPSS